MCRKGEGLESDYVCKKPKNCETFKKMIENGHNPVVCSFVKFQPIICCPTVTRIETSIIPDAIVKHSNSADKSTWLYYFDTNVRYYKGSDVDAVGKC